MTVRGYSGVANDRGNRAADHHRDILRRQHRFYHVYRPKRRGSRVLLAKSSLAIGAEVTCKAIEREIGGVGVFRKPSAISGGIREL